MTREMKNSGVEWIGDIPSEWEIVKVKSIFNIGRGRVIAKTELYDSGYPIYSSQTKNNGILGYIGTYDYDVDQLTWTTDGANAGTVFLRTGKYNCTNVCGTLALKNNLNCLLYMKYALEYIAIFHKRPDTNGYKIMNNEMADIKVTAPPLHEQKRIADFLDSKVTEIDKIISETRASIENYKEYKQSVITEAVTKGLDKNVPMKDSGIEWIGEIPVDWKVMKIKNACSLKTGSTPSTEHTEWFNGSLKWITPCDFNEKYLIEETDRTLSEQAEIDNVATIIPANSVLIIGIGGTAGKVGYIKEKCSCNQQITALIPKDITAKYLMYWMIANTKFLKDTALYTTLPILNNQTIGTYLLISPNNRRLQGEIVNYLDKQCSEIEFLISEKEALISNLEEYKKSFIYEYVTGKKEIFKVNIDNRKDNIYDKQTD